MKCYVGIDGGGTKTALRVMDQQGNLLVESSGGSTNLCSNSVRDVNHNLRILWESTCSQYRGSLEPISICMGVAGISKSDVIHRMTGMLQDIFQCKSVQVLGDLELSLSPFMGESVIVLTSGTGSVCCGKPKSGELFRSGGYGHILGDEGSAYHLGILAIKHLLKNSDLLIKRDNLMDMIFTKTSFKSKQSLLDYVYGDQFNKCEIAQISRIVVAAAQEEDMIAQSLLDIMVTHLFELIQRVCIASGMEEFSLVLRGGLLEGCEYISKKLYQQVEEQYKVKRVIPQKDLCGEAIDMARVMENSKE